MKRDRIVAAAAVGTIVLAGLPLATRLAAQGNEGKVVPIKIMPINPKAAAKVSYSKNIKPLLQSQCSGCHGAGAKKAGLDVTSVASLRKGGRENGPGVVPGKPDQSSIVEFIRGVKTPQMPMRHKPLSAAQLHMIREWIAAGAKDDSHKAAPAKHTAAPAKHKK